MVTCGFDDPGGDFIERKVVGFDAEVGGIAVERGADLEKVTDGFLGIVVVEKGAVGVP